MSIKRCLWNMIQKPADVLNKTISRLKFGNPNPEDWAELMEFDEDFQEEFNKIVSDNNIKEADATFTPEVFDDMYMNM